MRQIGALRAERGGDGELATRRLGAFAAGQINGDGMAGIDGIGSRRR